MRSSLWLWWCATTWMKVKHRGHSQGRKGPREVIGRSINADELHQLRRDQTFQRLKHMAGHLAESARFTSVQNHNWKKGFFVNSFSEHTSVFCDKNKRLFWHFFGKVNSVQEAYAKCFTVHILKFQILQIAWKKWNNEHQTLSFHYFTNIFSILMFFVLFFHVVWKFSNFDMWTTKHLA